MRCLPLAVAALLAVSGTAQAQTPGPYIGIEGGPLFLSDRSGQLETGLDVGAIAGYNFNLFRLEGDLTHKRARAGDGSYTRLLSGTVNGLIYYGAAGYGIYAGAGVGRAHARAMGQSESMWARQLIAGAHAPIAGMLTGGVKYRYLRTGRVKFGEDGGNRFSAHSILVSIVYNFGPPLPEPPLPDLPPLGQLEQSASRQTPSLETCPGGNVQLPIERCPKFRGPPVTPERGQT